MEESARIFESRYALILEVGRRYAPDGSLAHDIVQQTFLVFMQGVERQKWTPRLMNDSQINLLLYGIAKRVALNLWNKESKYTIEALLPIAERFQRRFSEKEDGPDEQAEAYLTALKECLKKLPEERRRQLEEHYRENISIEEIARKNSLRSDSLRQVFCRLRSTLKRCIEKIVREEGAITDS